MGNLWGNDCVASGVDQGDEEVGGGGVGNLGYNGCVAAGVD